MLPIRSGFFTLALWWLGWPKGHMEIMHGSDETPLSIIGLYRMRVPPSGALNMSGSPHLTIGYLLSDEWKDLKSNSYGRLIKLRD